MAANRYQILQRDGFRCFYCGATASREKLHVDHVVPKSRGGSDSYWNLVTACSPCNLSKSNAMPSDEVIRAAYERDLNWWYQRKSTRYLPCEWCSKPVDVSEYDTVTHVACDTCNRIASEAYLAGWNSACATEGVA